MIDRHDPSADLTLDILKVSTAAEVNGLVVAGGTVDTAGGAQSISASEFVSGYAYVGDAGGAVALTTPTAAAIATELLDNHGIVMAAGMRFPPIIIENTTANALTVTGGTGVTIAGTAAVNNTAAIAYPVATSASAITIVVVVGA